MDFFAPFTLMLWRMTMSPMSRMEEKIQWINLSQLVRMRSIGLLMMTKITWWKKMWVLINLTC